MAKPSLSSASSVCDDHKRIQEEGQRPYHFSTSRDVIHAITCPMERMRSCPPSHTRRLTWAGQGTSRWPHDASFTTSAGTCPIYPSGEQEKTRVGLQRHRKKKGGEQSRSEALRATHSSMLSSFACRCIRPQAPQPGRPSYFLNSGMTGCGQRAKNFYRACSSAGKARRSHVTQSFAPSVAPVVQLVTLQASSHSKVRFDGTRTTTNGFRYQRGERGIKSRLRVT